MGNIHINIIGNKKYFRRGYRPTMDDEIALNKIRKMVNHAGSKRDKEILKNFIQILYDEQVKNIAEADKNENDLLKFKINKFLNDL